MDCEFKGCTDYFKNGDEIKGLTVGNSMYPLFKNERDIVTVKKMVEKPKKNDVLLYKKSNSDGLILHRLLKITDDGMIIRGDNQYVKETDVTFDRVVGVMTSFERKGKYYECDKSKAYQAYVIYIRLSYPIRRLLHKFKSLIIRIKRYYRKKTV